MLTHFLLALVLATTSAAEHHNSEVPAASQKLLAFAIETQQSHAHFAAVWPGFWSENTPFITYSLDGQAVLFTTEEPIAGYEQLADNYYYYAERFTKFNRFIFSYSVFAAETIRMPRPFALAMTRQLTQIIAKPCCMKLFMAINVTHLQIAVVMSSSTQTFLMKPVIVPCWHCNLLLLNRLIAVVT